MNITNYLQKLRNNFLPHPINNVTSSKKNTLRSKYFPTSNNLCFNFDKFSY